MSYRIDISKRHDHRAGDREIWEPTFWCRGIHDERNALGALSLAREINNDSSNKPVFRLVRVDDTETVLDA